METKNQNPINEAVLEGTQMAGKWFNEATTSALDLYKKQLNLAAGFYGNLFNTMWGESMNAWKPFPNYNNLFSSNGQLPVNPFLSFTNLAQPNDLFEQFNKMIRQYNQRFMSALSGQFEHSNLDLKALNEKYQDISAKELEAFRKIVQTFNDTLNNQIDLSMEANKKLQEEITRQLNQVLKINQQFWMEALDLSSTTAQTAKSTKDTSGTENKRQAKNTELA